MTHTSVTFYFCTHAEFHLLEIEDQANSVDQLECNRAESRGTQKIKGELATAFCYWFGNISTHEMSEHGVTRFHTSEGNSNHRAKNETKTLCNIKGEAIEIIYELPRQQDSRRQMYAP